MFRVLVKPYSKSHKEFNIDPFHSEAQANQFIDSLLPHVLRQAPDRPRGDWNAAYTVHPIEDDEAMLPPGSPLPTWCRGGF